MKKELILTPLLPFTSDEETALADKLDAMDPVALAHYVDSARLALGNTALDPSWRPRVEFGLKHAQRAALREPVPVGGASEAPASKPGQAVA